MGHLTYTCWCAQACATGSPDWHFQSGAGSVQWRQGPHGSRTLCNACGIAWMRGKLKMPVVSFTPSVQGAALKTRQAQRPKGACKVMDRQASRGLRSNTCCLVHSVSASQAF